MKCLGKILLSIFIFLLIVAIIVVVLITRTPRQLKVHNKPIVDGETFESLGLADTKFIEIFKSFKNLSKVKEEDMVKNKYDATAEASNMQGVATGSDLDSSNYGTIAERPVTYQDDVMVVYKDTTLAYLFNEAVQKPVSDSKFKDLGLVLEEISITKADANIRMVGSIQVSDDDAPKIPLITIPKKVYVVYYFTLSADNQGVATLTAKSVKINDGDDPVVKSVLDKILEKHKVEGIEDANSDAKLQATANDLAKEFSKVVNNIGKLGTATITDGSDPFTVGAKKIDPATKKYGMDALLKDGLIAFLGHKAS